MRRSVGSVIVGVLAGTLGCGASPGGSAPASGDGEVGEIGYGIATAACTRSTTDLRALRRETQRTCASDADCAGLPRGVCSPLAIGQTQRTCAFDASCVSDADCTTCGSSCDAARGTCWAECLADADCATPGHVCSARGVCGPPAPPTVDPFGRSPDTLTYVTKGLDQTLVVTGPASTTAAVSRVNVAAPADVGLACPTTLAAGTSCSCVGTAPSARCSLTLGPALPAPVRPLSIALSVRYATTSTAVAPSSRTVVFTSGSFVRSTELALTAPPTTPIAGRYAGTLELYESGIDGVSEPSAFAGKPFPVTIDVTPYGSEYRLFVTDAAGVFGSSQRAQLRASACSNGTCDLSLGNADAGAPADRSRLVTRVPVTTFTLSPVISTGPISLAGSSLVTSPKPSGSSTTITRAVPWTVRMSEGAIAGVFSVETADLGRGLPGGSGLVIAGPPPSNHGAALQWKLTAKRTGDAPATLPAWTAPTTSVTQATALPRERPRLTTPTTCSPWKTYTYWESPPCPDPIGPSAASLDPSLGTCAPAFRTAWDAVAAANTQNTATVCEWPDTRFPAGFIPCGTISGEPYPLGTGFPECVVQELATSGTAWCAQLQTNHGCVPAIIPYGSGQLGGCYLPGHADDAARCAERALCETPGVTFSSSAYPPNQDLACASGAPSAPPSEPFFRAVSGSQLATTQPASLLASCLADLRNADGASVLGVDQCMHARSIANAIALSSAPARDAATTSNTPADALFHRLVAQWLEVIAFASREAAVETFLEPILPGTTSAPSRSAAIDAIDAGFALLTHPRTASALARLDGAVVRSPDYRTRLFPSVSYGGVSPETVGLPVAMLSTAALYLDLVGAQLDETARAGSPDVTRAHVALRHVQVIEALAAGLHRRACTGGVCSGTALPTWETQHTRARRQLADAVSRIAGRLVAIGSGAYATGFGPGEIPVWFSGHDVPGDTWAPSTGTAQVHDEHHAASSRLLRLARTRAADAATSESLVVGAWQTYLSDTFTARSARRTQAARVTDATVTAGREIRELCGEKRVGSTRIADDQMLAWIDANGDGVLDQRVDTSGDGAADVEPTMCFLDAGSPGCQPGANTVASYYQSSTDADKRLAVCLSGMLARRSPPTGNTTVDAMGRYLAQGDVVAVASTALFPTLPAYPAGTQRLILNSNIEYIVQLSDLFGGLARAPLTPEDVARCTEAPMMQGGKIPSPTQQAASPYGNKTCFRGVLGEDMVASYAAIEAARAASLDVAAQVDLYTLRANACRALEANHALALEDSATYGQRMAKLAQRKADAVTVGGFFSFLTNVLTLGIAGSGSPDPFGAATNAAVAQIDAQMQQARDAHELRQQQFAAQRDVAACHENALEALVGLGAANARARQAEQLVVGAGTRLLNDHARLRAAVGEGRASIERESSTCDRAGATGACIPGYTYLDLRETRMREHQLTLARARAAGVLASSAAQYELGRSLTSTGCMLTATTAAQLSSCIEGTLVPELATPVASRATLMKYSVCAILHPLSEQAIETGGSTFAGGDCDRQAFRRLLRDPRLAVGSGTARAQRVPFRIDPVVTAVPQWAERIHGVGVAISGGAVTTLNTAQVQIDFRKRNTFASQANPFPTPHDPLTTQLSPCRNLLLPAGVNDETPRNPAECAPDGFSRFGLNALTPQDPSFATMLTSQSPTANWLVYSGELAGWGPYGDYEILLPSAAHLDPEQIDDLWVVLDVRTH